MSYEWVVYALLSAVTAALVAIFAKMGLSGVDSNVATFVRAIIMMIFLFIVVLFQGKLSDVSGIVNNFKVFKFIILSGVAGASSWLFYFLALKVGKASQVVPVDRLSIVFTLILAFLILSEKVDWKTIIGSVIVTVGAIIIAL